MANTYFKMEVEEIKGRERSSPSIDLTAFVGGKKSIQLTLAPMPISNPSYGCNYTTLSNEEATRLAKALMERVEGKITATGYERSEYSDKDEEE
jgi:hypothetical protein